MHSTFEAAYIEYFRLILANYSPTEFLAALEWVQAELVAEDYLPPFPAGGNASP